jgi:GNAT superfamily N-acetyltransferase
MAIPFQHIRETRRARADEADHLLRLLAEADPTGPLPFADAPAFIAYLARTDAIVYVAAPVTEQAIGIVAAEPAPLNTPPNHAPAGYVASLLWVAPRHRRAGWGSKLAGQALAWARRRGARGVAFAIPATEGRAAAESFARSRGWRLTPGWGIAELEN